MCDEGHLQRLGPIHVPPLTQFGLHIAGNKKVSVFEKIYPYLSTNRLLHFLENFKTLSMRLCLRSSTP